MCGLSKKSTIIEWIKDHYNTVFIMLSTLCQENPISTFRNLVSHLWHPMHMTILILTSKDH